MRFHRWDLKPITGLCQSIDKSSKYQILTQNGPFTITIVFASVQHCLAVPISLLLTSPEYHVRGSHIPHSGFTGRLIDLFCVSSYRSRATPEANGFRFHEFQIRTCSVLVKTLSLPADERIYPETEFINKVVSQQAVH